MSQANQEEFLSFESEEASLRSEQKNKSTTSVQLQELKCDFEAVTELAPAELQKLEMKEKLIKVELDLKKASL